MQYDEYVYLIRHPDGYYKIGLSNNPAKRKQNLGAGTPYTLEIDYLINTPNSETVENILHDALRNERHKREWFEISDGEIIHRVKSILSNSDTPDYKIYDKESHNGLFNPPKPDVIEEGNMLFVSYQNSRASMTKMAHIRNVEFDFDDDFQINKINIKIDWKCSGSSHIKQERGGCIELKKSVHGDDTLRDISDDVTLTSFTGVNL